MRALVIGLIASTVVTVGALLWAQSIRTQLRDQRVVFANQLAAKDTAITRLTVVNDSQVSVTRRLAYQADVELPAARQAYADLLDTVEVMGVALAQFEIRGDSLEQVIAGRDAEKDSLGTITVEGELDSLGVRVTANVAIPPTLVSPVWRWSVVREPLRLSVGLQCEGPLAAAYITGPAWASVAVDSIVQDDRICNPLPSNWQPFAIEMPSVPVIVALVGIGMFVQSKLSERGR